jgi:hypothetical protein
LEGRELAEAYGWLFVDFIPLLYEKRRVSRQLQVETWLDLSQLLQELKLEPINKNMQNANPTIDYVI